MKIDFTIENERIKLQNADPLNDRMVFVKLYDICKPGFSLLRMKGKIGGQVSSFFEAHNDQGIILSIQLIPDNSRFEFESFNSISVNFTPSVESVQLMLANTPFKHSYENPGTLNRLDIYIPPAKVASFIPTQLLDQLLSQKILNLNRQGQASLTMYKSLDKLSKELEKPKSKSLCTLFENFIRSVVA